ncbi:D-2-hydroxyacid dehydrogenase [Occultella glacieicola]|uniref:D-2-hydroxyacid dehydrogenase n=1 Tax=Occultella glacieicola TaxID=2518684 RepID=A0ABY2E1P9_9MICO|nr:D-2-hydroxyacid dehydrogenase [Occultella glacieicola]TDE91500.1 D-2-hydroxyacid dehydrogenase [Occultella glacieicola]
MQDTAILVLGEHGPERRERLVTAAAGRPLWFAPHSDPTAGGADFDPAHVRAVLGAGGPAHLDPFPNVDWVHGAAAGVNALLTPEVLERRLTITSAAGNGAVPLAEHALMLMLMLNRDALRWLAAQRERRWERFTHGELAGSTVGIIGLGHSGMDLAAKAKACHMRVVGLARTPRPGGADNVDRIYAVEQLHDLLAESDFVVMTAPYTPSTRGLLGAAEFAAMKPSAFYICFSRGGIADDDALLAALREGIIAGAGLDAHAEEPLPPESPFWDLENVIITPHNGATSPGTGARGFDIMVENLTRYTAGEPLRNVVDQDAGY